MGDKNQEEDDEVGRLIRKMNLLSSVGVIFALTVFLVVCVLCGLGILH